MPVHRSTPASRVTIWQLNLSDWRRWGDACESMLTPSELAQADRFRHPEGRQRFVLGRGMMRGVLGKLLDAKPREVALQFSGQGKPHLAGEDGMHFNLSHSGEMILLGVTSNGEIGVDIEAFRHLPRRDQIAEGILSATELNQYETLSDAQRQAAFFTIWTRKEAIVKAVGRGLCFPLTDVEVSFTPDARVLRFGEAVGEDIPWRLSSIACPAGYAAALATSHQPSEISVNNWMPNG